MRKFLISIILLIFSSALFAQTTYVIPRDLRLGGNLKITAGTQITPGFIIQAYHIGCVENANRPTLAGGILSFDAVNDYLISAITPTISMQKIYIVAQVNGGGYKLYTSLTGIGELTAGILTLGANSALSAFYDVDIKELVIRNDANVANDNMFKDYLMYKHNVTLAP